MIISIASFKGGVGKTTISVHLAAYLAKKGKTLLIDGDPNRSATVWSERGTLPYPVVNEGDSKPVTEQMMHIVLDTPARPEYAELQTLAADSDLILIPVTPDLLSISALLLTTDTLAKIGATNYRILLTQIPPRSNAGRDARTLLAEQGLTVLRAEIRRRAVFGRSVILGTTVDKLKDGGDAWQEIVSVGKEILK